MSTGLKRVLCIIGNMNTGGAETFLMKLYRCMDKTIYQMDFCLQVEGECYYENEIKAFGGRIYRIPPKSDNIKGFKCGLSKIIKENNYKYVLRITSNAMGFWDLKIAKEAGAKVCIARSSNSSDGGGIKKALAHRLGQLLYGKYVDVRVAPSDLSAKYTFGNRAYTDGKVRILHNAVDVDAYKYSQIDRIAIREEFNIDQNALLIGHIGRFMKQKNHRFLLEIFKAIMSKKSDSKLILIGNGIMEGQVKQWCAELGVNKNVIFTGVRSDVSRLLSAMDVFVFPSLYEGMPNTVIEAQANGLPCVISDTITKEADITGLIRYMSLERSAEEWAAAVDEQMSMGRKDTRQAFIDAKYDINEVVKEFVSLVFQEGN